jgi:hypothetical protein
MYRIDEPSNNHLLQLLIDHHVLNSAKLQQLVAHFFLALKAAHGHKNVHQRNTMVRVTGVPRHHLLLLQHCGGALMLHLLPRVIVAWDV